jgi:hypothetical protein
MVSLLRFTWISLIELIWRSTDDIHSFRFSDRLFGSGAQRRRLE